MPLPGRADAQPFAMHRFNVAMVSAVTILGLAFALAPMRGLFIDAVRATLTSQARIDGLGSLSGPRTRVLWSADMESNGNPGPDLGQWYSPDCCAHNGGGLFSSGLATAGPSFDYNHTPGGEYSAMLRIATPSTPTSGARLFRWLEPQTYPDLYYRAWYYFPQLYTPNGDPAWWQVFQWKSNGKMEGNNPVYGLNIGVTTYQGQPAMSFYLCPSSRKCVSQAPPVALIPYGNSQWTRIDAHYVCAADDSGHVTIWQDGKQLFDLSGATRYADGDCQWSVSNYSNGLSPSPSAIYVDDAAICLGGLCP